MTHDSRVVKPGYLFAALPGSAVDGRAYIAEAVRNGAKIILAPEGTTLPEEALAAGVTLLTDPQPRRVFALMAAEFYGVQPETIVAVTGTNGKTSVVHFVRQIWQAVGKSAASMGTLGVQGDATSSVTSFVSSMTTPDPATLYERLKALARAGVTHLALEASSHGLDQYRLDGAKIRAAGFTNLSRDHLDYHESMEAYFEAKTRQFSSVMEESGTAVLNADCPEYKTLEEICVRRGMRLLSYGKQGKELKILSAAPLPQGQIVDLEVAGHTYNDLTLPLVGDFQLMNVLCALGLVLADDPGNETAYVEALEKLESVPGRLQQVCGHPFGAAVYVDYAHTPDALTHVLKALRLHTEGKLVCVMGCGGDRDKGKRHAMGEVAAALADRVIVTDDNPRGENPARIRVSVMEGAPGALEIAGRRVAIRVAVEGLERGDVLLIAGKGHEQGQIFKDRTEPFDDVEEVQQAMDVLRHKREERQA